MSIHHLLPKSRIIPMIMVTLFVCYHNVSANVEVGNSNESHKNEYASNVRIRVKAVSKHENTGSRNQRGIDSKWRKSVEETRQFKEKSVTSHHMNLFEKIKGRNDENLNRFLAKRITGGRNVTSFNEFPSYVNIDNACGGTLIDQYFVLTAAHCVDLPEYQPPFVRIGGINSTTGIMVPTKEFIIHPLYKYEYPEFDVAIIRLDCASRRAIQRLNFDRDLPALTISTSTGLIVPQPLVAIGEGDTSFKGPASGRMQKVTLNVVPSSTCQNAWYPRIGDEVNVTFTEHEHLVMCAGNLERDGIDTCQGDSGGPLYLMMGQPSVPVQVGITSLGMGCGDKTFPGLYNRVSGYEKFIKDTIADGYTKINRTRFCRWRLP